MRRHQSGCGGTAALALLVALAGGPAHAQLGLSGDLPRHQVRLSSLTAATYNPLGLQTDLQLGYRYRLFDSKSLLLRHAFVGVFHSLRINPAYTRLGSGVELQPMAVLTLRALYELRGYFGTAGMLQSWASPYAAHDDDTNAARAEEAYRTLGHQVMLQAVLRARLGPVAVLNELTTHWFHMDLGSGDRVFYDAFFDTLVPGRGWLVANHAHLLLLGGRRLVVDIGGGSTEIIVGDKSDPLFLESIHI